MQLPHKKQRGFLLIVAIVFIVIIAGMLIPLTAWFVSGTRTSGNSIASKQAFYLAQSGLERARYALAADPNPAITDPWDKRYACNEITGSTFTNQTLGAGKFTVTGTAYTGSSTLSATIVAGNTVIPVVSTAGFAPSGLVVIGGEQITYGKLSATCTPFPAPCLTEITRGAEGTTPAGHNAGTAVTQDECFLESTGGVPDLQDPPTAGINARHVLTQGMTALKDFANMVAVGKEDGSDYYIVRWDGDQWVQESSNSTSSRKDLKSVFMVTGTDGWTVGQNRRFLQWNGSVWGYDINNLDLSGWDLVPDKTYWGVACINSSLCFAVGDQSKTDVPGGPEELELNIVKWNGNIWRRDGNFTGYDEEDGNLRAVACAGNSFCAVVGEKGRENFWQWNGSNWSPMSVDTSGNDAVPDKKYYDIACVNPSLCYAVGEDDSNGAGLKLNIVKWNGSIWRRETNFAAGQGDDGDKLFGVGCPETGYCWVVGEKRRDFYYLSGGQWQAGNIQTTGPTEVPDKEYHSVKCYDPYDCWAVGHVDGGNLVSVHWNGTIWKREPTTIVNGEDLDGLSLIDNVIGEPPFSATSWRESFQSP